MADNSLRDKRPTYDLAASGAGVVTDGEVPKNASALSFKDVLFGPSGAIQIRANFELRRSEVMVLVGNNGAGKSSLLRCAAGVLLPQQGEVMLGEQPMSQGGARVSNASRSLWTSKVAYMPQTTSNDAPLTVGEFWDLVLEQGSRKSFAGELAEDFGINRFHQRSLGELSMGELQKVTLASRLVLLRDVVLLDEPTSFADARGSRLATKWIKRCASMGSAFLVVLHDAAWAARIADRAGLVHDGVMTELPPKTFAQSSEYLAALGLDDQDL